MPHVVQCTWAFDLVGHVGTPVHSFSTGTIHAVGYNHALGDYGNVIVLQYQLPPVYDTTSNSTRQRQAVYALYGHLDDASIVHKKVGDSIRAGQVLGWMGDVHGCGGWQTPHAHFQLSPEPLLTHDMPGAVEPEHRSPALVSHPDPRYVLGALH